MLILKLTRGMYMGYVPTTNYGFQKPEKTNAFNVDDLNNALDKIDETIKKIDNIPDEMGLLNMQWLTPDRLNIEGAIFKGQGPDGQSFTIEGGADGRTEKLVSHGRWTISVEHGGSYDNDKPQVVDVESKQSYLVMFGASDVLGALVVSDYFIGATIDVTNSDGTPIYSGKLTPMTLNVGLGQIHVKIVQGGVTDEFDLTVAGKTGIPSERFINVTWSEALKTFANAVECMGEKLSTTLLEDHFCTLRNVGTEKITFHGNEQWSDGQPMTASLNIGIAEDDVVVNIECTDPIIYTSSGTKTLPYAGKTYYVTVIGGGGGGTRPGRTYGGDGGDAGQCNAKSVTPTSDNLSLNITIGAKGTGGSNSSTSYANIVRGSAGGTTSVSGAVSVSASGGSGGPGDDIDGGDGGDGTSGKIRDKSISGGAGGVAPTSSSGGSSPVSGKSSNITEYPELSIHFDSTSGNGGMSGYVKISGSTYKTNYKYGGDGGNGIKGYGNGGKGGRSVEKNSNSGWTYTQYNGTDGTDGAVFVEMKL